MLNNVPVEIFGLYDDNKFISPDNNNCAILDSIINYAHIHEKPIIKILHDIRESNNTIVYNSIKDMMTATNDFNHQDVVYILEKKCIRNCVRVDDTTIRFPLNQLSQIGETIESVIMDDIAKIKNIKICCDDNNIMFDSFNNINHMKPDATYRIKKYIVHGTDQVIKGLLLANYNIPIVSTQHAQITMEIEFNEYDDDEITIVHTLLPNKLQTIFKTAMYELDMRPGLFILFGCGTLAEHFSRDGGNLSKLYQSDELVGNLKILFDLAHEEAIKRAK